MNEQSPFSASPNPPELVVSTNTRPVSPKVLGVLNIAFALLGVVGTAWSLVVMNFVTELPQPADGMQNPALEAMKNPEYRNAIMMTMPIGLTAMLLLGTSGIGLFKYRRWGRTAAIAYVVLAVIAVAAGVFVNYQYIYAPLLESAKNAGEDPQAMGGAVSGIAGGALGTCVGLVYPFILLIFMLQTRVRESLD